jgi:uncharacterized DUF497 family protein
MHCTTNPLLFVRRLIWDTWNIAHIARYDVIPDEVEEVCHGHPVTSQTYQGRIRVIGPTSHQRMLTVMLAPTDERGVYSPVTARPADRNERRQYREPRGIHERWPKRPHPN